MLYIPQENKSSRANSSSNDKEEDQHEEFDHDYTRAFYKNEFDHSGSTSESTWDSCESPADHVIHHSRELLPRAKSFSRLRTHSNIQLLLEDTPIFDYLKKIAIHRLSDKIGQKLEMLQRLCACDEPEPDDKLTHNIFSWSMDDFLKRRDLHDFVWVDVMQRISDDCLAVYKFKQDVEQLEIFLRKIFEGFNMMKDYDDGDVKEKVVLSISNATRVLYISENIDQELQGHNQLYWELGQKDTFLANIKRESVDKMMRIYMETKLMNSHIWNPIELRYQMSWYTAIVNQMIYRQDSIVTSRQQDIAQTREKTDIETRINASCMDFYYTAIGVIKSQLGAMQKKFDDEYEEIENRIILKKSRIEKLRDEWNFRTEEIERFHEEMQIIRRREEQQNAERELKRLEDEALALQKRKSKLDQAVIAKAAPKRGVPNRVAVIGKANKVVKSKKTEPAPEKKANTPKRNKM